MRFALAIASALALSLPLAAPAAAAPPNAGVLVPGRSLGGIELGPIDAVVSNAGWDDLKPFVATDEAFWHKVIDINFYGTLRMIHAVLPGMLERRWGRAYGVCGDCSVETWYFNYFAFQPRGVGVELRKGRVAALFTLYQPPGWRTTKGLTLGDSVARVTAVYGALVRRECVGYSVLVLPGRGATTGFYVLADQLWAFGLSRPGVPLCR